MLRDTVGEEDKGKKEVKTILRRKEGVSKLNF